MYKDKNKAKEYARLSMAIKRAKKKGSVNLTNLLTQRESLKVTNNKDITKKHSFDEKNKSEKQRIILGTSDFKKLRLNNAIIVDKSLLIKAVLEAPSEVSLITRPRR
jgi:hypothetical protein